MYDLKLEDPDYVIYDDETYEKYDDDEDDDVYEASDRRRHLWWGKSTPEPEHWVLEDEPEDDPEPEPEPDTSKDYDNYSSGDDDWLELPWLSRAPYALMINNWEGFRIYGNQIADELCYQALLHKKPDKSAEKSKDKKEK